MNIFKLTVCNRSKSNEKKKNNEKLDCRKNKCVKNKMVKNLLQKRSLKSYSNLAKTNCVICFIESALKMMENAFYFILKALFVLKIFKFLT